MIKVNELLDALRVDSINSDNQLMRVIINDRYIGNLTIDYILSLYDECNVVKVEIQYDYEEPEILTTLTIENS
jgi:hypothetical protein